jgi:hypothetical protein
MRRRGPARVGAGDDHMQYLVGHGVGDREEQRRKIFAASDDLSFPRPPSLSDRQHLIRPWGEHLNVS